MLSPCDCPKKQFNKNLFTFSPPEFGDFFPSPAKNLQTLIESLNGGCWSWWLRFVTKMAKTPLVAQTDWRKSTICFASHEDHADWNSVVSCYTRGKPIYTFIYWALFYTLLYKPTTTITILTTTCKHMRNTYQYIWLSGISYLSPQHTDILQIYICTRLSVPFIYTDLRSWRLLHRVWVAAVHVWPGSQRLQEPKPRVKMLGIPWAWELGWFDKLGMMKNLNQVDGVSWKGPIILLMVWGW